MSGLLATLVSQTVVIMTMIILHLSTLIVDLSF